MTYDLSGCENSAAINSTLRTLVNQRPFLDHPCIYTAVIDLWIRSSIRDYVRHVLSSVPYHNQQKEPHCTGIGKRGTQESRILSYKMLLFWAILILEWSPIWCLSTTQITTCSILSVSLVRTCTVTRAGNVADQHYVDTQHQAAPSAFSTSTASLSNPQDTTDYCECRKHEQQVAQIDDTQDASPGGREWSGKIWCLETGKAVVNSIQEAFCWEQQGLL
jgi:hypothetical protein